MPLLADVASVLVRALVMYAALVLVLRLNGNRALTNLRAFDLVVTFALGSVLAATLMAPDPALARGLTAVVLLLALQGALAWAAARSDAFARLVVSRPMVLARGGRVDAQRMRRANVTREQLATAARLSGAQGLDDVEEARLEPNGDVSVTLRRGGGTRS